VAQRVAHRPSGGSGHHTGADHETGVVIDARHDLGLRPAGEPDPAHDVHLPQLHRPAAFPTLVIGPLPLAGLRGDQPMADQTALDRSPPRQRLGPLPPQPGTDRPGPPPGMLSAQPHHPSLDDRVHLMRTRQRPTRAVSQPPQPPGRVGPQPNVHRLTGHTMATGHVDHGGAVDEDLQHSLIALLHQSQLHQHAGPPSHPRAQRPQRRR
jgi:hypothetical protein